jgi:hypothetical protein
MIRSTILATCVLGFCTIALAQPVPNVHQQKQATTATQPADTTTTKAVAPARPNEMMADLALGQMHCPAGVHYFIGHNPCIPPSPWDQK